MPSPLASNEAAKKAELPVTLISEGFEDAFATGFILAISIVLAVPPSVTQSSFPSFVFLTAVNKMVLF